MTQLPCRNKSDAHAKRLAIRVVWLVADVECDAAEQEERADWRNDAHLLLTQQCRQDQLTAAVQ